MARTPQRRRDARHQQPPAQAPAVRRGPSGGTKKPITVDAIVDAAFRLIAEEGYDALTMRRLATELETGPASLYAHVVNKDDLGELLIGRLCARIDLPEPDPRTWRQQITGICAQLRDEYLRYPGISRAALAIVPSNLETLRVAEGMLATLLAGGVAPQTAAWTADALGLYVNAYCLEHSLRTRDDPGLMDRDELLGRFAALPDTFPQTRRYATELTAGDGHDRFDFTVALMIGGL
ncbi:TetR/AcrR family transcriptional regulator [Actinoplanes sp. NBRC 103695]|uniref:TetR/AcrR family transcriptional regulator n=1 Tax=Actinoplanes sp. NBRC 103695 TaxID=3032202 RepID=UPI0024A419BC|nr:TetR/AcrR family transcriptional regulator [Actinoplanes sp. NBRC 103695]GLY95293.1 transcriptional regulator [Actinoplanes sp. NBRC 103695]